MANPGGAIIRRSIRVRGVVQGVGFRPSMFRLAKALRVSGFVLNDDDGVLMEVEGKSAVVSDFVSKIAAAAPAIARIEAVDLGLVAPRGDAEFSCAPSEEKIGAARSDLPIPRDLPPCDDCLREVDDPSNVRFRYPFVACVSCGPRFTIVRSVPYDRERTTMSAFAPCGACDEEYRDPGDRRFHAEANACPRCGPRARLVGRDGSDLSGGDAISSAARVVAGGGIVAVKGVGGFALAVDATNRDAVALLRRRKRRPHKPFAVMARNLETLARVAVLDDAAREALTSVARPIVLLPLQSDTELAPNVAPGLVEVGAFLPPTPLQYLLLGEGTPLQVMTSANLAGEPLAASNEEAFARLRDVADAFLVHDREIHSAADDSVTRIVAGAPMPVRRARGFVPESLRIPVNGPCVLALGGELKSTICFADGGRAILSPHVGDLRDPAADALFGRWIERLGALLGAEPVAVAHDLHPDYRSTLWAETLGLERLGVQHHHAHVAACLAEHGRVGPALGVAFDGTGYGPDGALWGGEFLEADLAGCRRIGHLAPLAMPGGERAIREPWRLALAALIDAGESLDALAEVDEDRLSRTRMLLELTSAARGPTSAAPVTTSAGRWFDVAAALVGFRGTVSYEGQAAIELEAMSAGCPALPYEICVEGADPFVLGLRAAVHGIARDVRRGVARSIVAARFHETMAQAILYGCRLARARTGLATVALSGGCFQNRRMTERANELLAHDGFEVLIHRRVPPNDGGLSFGQAAILSHHFARSH
jgi:hydrogenase maturation protein HypF